MNCGDPDDSKSVEISFFLGIFYGFITIAAQADSLQIVPIGSWGGDHIRLEVTETGATVEYDCAYGSIEGPLFLDKADNFEARGIYIFERGGPHQ